LFIILLLNGVLTDLLVVVPLPTTTPPANPKSCIDATTDGIYTLQDGKRVYCSKTWTVSGHLMPLSKRKITYDG